MDRILDGLKPANVFGFFEDICSIPHVSHHTGRMTEFLMEFAEKRNLRAVKDDAGNVVIYKDASEGYEDRPTVILQGHTDMVGAKREDCEIDFVNEHIKLNPDTLKDGYVSAIGTTLGGDDGIAVAYELAILDDDSLKHPALEAVFTVDEEVGLLGANAFDTGLLSGKYMLNLDSEDEGIFLTGCAGGLRSDLMLEVGMTEYAGVRTTITISGLLGGHSGNMIGTGRPSANVLMGRLLKSIDEQADFYIESLEGGVVDNAICNKCVAAIVVSEDDIDALRSVCDRVEADLRTEYAGIDDGITISAETGESGTFVVANDIGREKILCLLRNLPYGVMARSGADVNFVETSLNLGVLRFSDGMFKAGYSIRSSMESAKRNLADRIEYLAEFLGGSYEESGDYPSWPRKTDSKLQEKASEVYESMYGSKPGFATIHAGLECGIFAGSMPKLDIISYGPNMLDIHTFEEKLDIESVARVYEFTVRLLSEIK